jgi:predicted nucleotide-binding protein (sugar kinase/HSP70/actin superfamily)
MIVTFPHMGTMHIVLKALFIRLGCEVLPPPPISKKTMELGTRLAPEAVCLPFKMTLGNFIEALQQGADTIITCGGVGPCRLGYYAEVQKRILHELGYKFNMVVVEPDVIDAYKNIRKVAPDKSWLEIYKAIRFAGTKMNALDDIEPELNMIRPRESSPGAAEAIWHKAVEAIDKAEDIEAIRNIRDETFRRLKTVRLKEGFIPLRIVLVGEIYVMLEPYVNQGLERCLGGMGVELHKSTYLSDYVRGHLLRRRDYLSLYDRLFALAKPYLGHYVGGHGLKSIAYTVFKKTQGYDGVIQVFPFTCMPEVIAKNIMPKVSKNVDMSVLTLAYDEQTGEAGIVTRLEAFIDLLRYRKSTMAPDITNPKTTGMGV